MRHKLEKLFHYQAVVLPKANASGRSVVILQSEFKGFRGMGTFEHPLFRNVIFGGRGLGEQSEIIDGSVTVRKESFPE